MRIRLNDIPADGKAFSCTRQTGELNSALSDLLKDVPYTIEFFIRPLNHRDFDLTGTMKTGIDDQCSRCGIDFNFKVDGTFHDILIPHQPDDRTGHYARANHVSDMHEQANGPGMAEYNADHTFEMGEYVHEQIAITLPFNPAPAEDAKGDCSLCGIKVKGVTFSYHEEMPEEKPANPFSVLKNLKI